MTVPLVLVVDDDDDIREIARLALRATAGWEVVVASDGHAAVLAAREHRPDVVLLDVMMPGMDGLGAVDALQAEAETRDLPVILFTAKLRTDDGPIAERPSIRGLIAKPFDPMTLAAEVSRILGWDVSDGPGGSGQSSG